MRLVSAAYGSVCYHDKESFPDIISSEHRLILDNITIDHPRCIPADKLAKKFVDSKNGSVSRGSSLGVSKNNHADFLILKIAREIEIQTWRVTLIGLTFEFHGERAKIYRMNHEINIE